MTISVFKQANNKIVVQDAKQVINPESNVSEGKAPEEALREKLNLLEKIQINAEINSDFQVSVNLGDLKSISKSIHI